MTDRRFDWGAPTRDPYADALASRDRDRASAAMMTQAVGPDDAGRANRLSRATGLPPETVERNLSDVEREQQVRDWRAAMQGSSALSSWASNPRNAAVASDDLRNAAANDEYWRRAATGMLKSAPRPQASFWNILQGVGANLSASVEGLKQAGDDFLRWAGVGAPAPRSASIPRLPDTGNVQLSKTRESQLRADQASPAFSNRFYAGVYGGVTSLIQQAPGLAASILTGNPAPGLAYAGLTQGTQSYGKYRARGGTPTEAAVGGAGEGAVEVATELLPMHHLISAFGKQGAKGFLSEVAKSVLADVPGEQIATLAQDAIDTAVANPDKTWGQYLKERPGAALETLVATITQGALTAGAAGIARTAMGRTAQAAEAEHDSANVNAAMDAAAQSKVRQRDPEAFSALVGLHTDNSPIEKLYVPAEAVDSYFQSHDLPPAEAAFWDQYADQIAEARANGGDIVIPMSDAAAHLAGTPAWEALRDDVRTSAGGMSPREAAAYREHGGPPLEEVAATIESERQADEPRRRLFDNVTRKLMDAGFTPDAARTQAELVTARAATRAARMGKPLTGNEYDNTDVVQVLPKALAPVVASDGLDITVAAMRRARGVAPKSVPSLLDWISKQGGIEDRGGDIAAMGGNEWHRGRPGRRKLIRDTSHLAQESMLGASDQQNANTPDELAVRAQEAAYLPQGERPTVNDLLDAIGEELRGHPRYAEGPQEDRTQAAAEELAQMLDQAGFDPAKATDSQIRDVIKRYRQEAQGQGYQQSAPATISGDEIGPRDMPTSELRKAARAWYDGNLKGKTLPSSVLGGDVQFAGSRKAFSASADPRKLRAFAALPELLNTADHVEDVPPRADKGEKNVKAYHYLEGTVDIGGEPTRVGITVREDNNGHFYYNHSVQESGAASNGPQSVRSKAAPVAEGQPLKQDIVDPGDGINMTLGQPGRGPRGRVSFEQNRTLIELFESRDLSTFVHETAHTWAEELRADAADPNASDTVRQDWEAVKAWFADNGHAVGEDGRIPVEAHELWARGVERYVMEGKSPSRALGKAFEAFRSWLLTIYRAVQNLRAPITSEIRSVMDRLVATDDEIAAAADEQRIKALFDDASTAGMTDAEFSSYRESLDTARSEAFDALLYRTMASVRAARTAEYREQRSKLIAETTKEVDDRPEWRAMAMLRDRDAGMKLDRQWIIDTYGADALDLMPKSVPLIYSENGTDADQIAELAGFENGDTMARTLMGIEARRKQMRAAGDKRSVRASIIEDEADATLRDRHGDPLGDGSIEREARELIHNDQQGEVIASELRALARRRRSTSDPNQAPTPYALAKRWAAEKVRDGNVRDYASRSAIERFRRTAQQTAGLAERAMLAGDVDEAFRQKQRQMLNNALIAEATAAADAIEVAVRRMSKIAKRRTMKTIDQDYLEQAQALLESVDLRERSQASIDRQESFQAWAEARAAEGRDIVVPASFAETIAQTNWSRLTVDNLLGLDAAVAQIMHLGRLKQTLIDAKEEREFDAVVSEAIDAAGRLPQKPPSNLMEPSWGERFKAGVANADAALLKMETIFDWLDGGDPNGVFNRVAFRPIAEAQDRENAMTADYFGRIKDAFSKIPEKVVKRWPEKIEVPGLLNRDTGAPFVLTRKNVIAIALNVGNEGNLQRLMDGYGWPEPAIRHALDSTLMKEEWQFVQGVWDIIDTLWADIAAMERRVNGVEPEKVEPLAVSTPFGELRGGYYPAIYDTTRSYRAEGHEGKASDLLETIYTKATTRARSTRERSEKVERPILLDTGVINRHIGEVIHDITHREAIINADRFLSSPRVMRAVDQSLGREMRQQFRPWLKFVANSWAMERAGNEGLGKWIAKARSNTTIVGMGFRLSTMMTQAAGYSNSIEFVGSRWVVPAIAQVAKNPVKTFQFVMQRSGEMATRMDTLDRDVRISLERMRGQAGSVFDAKRFMFHGIGYMDRVVAVPTWLAGYNKALAAGASEADAIYAGDKAVRVTQGAGSAKDLAAIQRGTGKWGEVLKLTTMFYSFFSAFYQRQRSLGRDIAGAVSDRDVTMTPQLMARAWWLIVVPPLLSEMLAGRGPDDDEDWGWWAFRKMLFQMLGPFPLVRDLGEPAWAKAVGKRSFGYSLSPMQRAGDTMVNVAGDVGQIARGEPTKRATRDSLEAVGYATGLVPGQLAASTQFLVDVGEGDQDPRTIRDWWDGLTTGRMQKH